MKATLHWVSAPHALPALLPSVEPGVIEVSVGKATVRIRGAGHWPLC